jgi:Flp pilus assembly pilin Flp
MSPRPRRTLTRLGRGRSVGAGRQDRGSSAVEFALLVAAIAAVLVAVTISLTSMVDSALSRTPLPCPSAGAVGTGCLSTGH